MTLHEYMESLRQKTVAVLGIGVSNTPLVQLGSRKMTSGRGSSWARWLTS